MRWMMMPLRRYAEFSGRSRRREFWMWVLFQILLYAAFVAAFAATIELMDNRDEWTVIIPLSLLYALLLLGFVVPALAVTVRRLHDTDRSGFNLLWNFVPFVGAIVLLIFYLSGGTRGPNRYGPDPKGANASTFA